MTIIKYSSVAYLTPDSYSSLCPMRGWENIIIGNVLPARGGSDAGHCQRVPHGHCEVGGLGPLAGLAPWPWWSAPTNWTDRETDSLTRATYKYGYVNQDLGKRLKMSIHKYPFISFLAIFLSLDPHCLEKG